MDAIKIHDLFDLTHTRAEKMLAACEYPWEALSQIGETVLEIGRTLDLGAYDHPAADVWIAKSATVAATASITGPCVIGEKTEVRPGAFIRGNVLVGDGAVVGNSCELKNCILFDGVQTPHYNYVGDSILGYKAHMGAGAVTSNVKGDKKNVVVHGEVDYETGRKKFGAMLGDFAEIGCNSVLNPGTIIGRDSQVYPLSCVRGVVKARHIVKGERGTFAKAKERKTIHQKNGLHETVRFFDEKTSSVTPRDSPYIPPARWLAGPGSSCRCGTECPSGGGWPHPRSCR